MSDDIVARLREGNISEWYSREREAADLIEQQAARIKAMERDVERYRSLIDATEINADSFTWRRNAKVEPETIVAEMDAIFGIAEG